MADLKKTVDVILNGRDRVSDKLQTVTRRGGRLAKGLGTLGTAAGAAAAALAALGGVAANELAQGLAAAYKEYADFEASLKDLEKVLGGSEEDMRRAKEAAKDMAVEFGKSSQEVVDSMTTWVQAGYDLDEAMTLAEDTIATTYASELDMAEATDTLTKVLKGFGVEVDNAREKMDVVNGISRNYSASVGQLSEALGRAGPVAESMGFSLEKLAAAMTPAIEKFQDGQKVGTAFKAVLPKLQMDTKRVSDAMDTLGVEQKTSNGEFKSGKELFYEVGNAFQDLEQNQKAFTAAQLAGREHAGKFLAVLNDWDKVSEVYEAGMQGIGSITEEVERKLESAQKQMERFQSASGVLAQTIGGKVAESFTNVVQSATDLVGALEEEIASGGADEFFQSINESADEFAKYLDGIADAMPEAFEEVDFETLAESVERVGRAFGDWFEDLDLTDPEQLAVAIQRVIDGVSELIDTFAVFVSWGDEIGATLVWMAEKVQQNASVLSSINSVWDVFITAAGAAVGAYEAFLHAIDYVPGIDMSGAIKSVENLGESIASYQLQLDEAKEKEKSFQDTVERTGKTAQDGKSDVEVLGEALNYAGDRAKENENKVQGFDNVLKSMQEGGEYHVELDAKADEESAKQAGKDAEKAAEDEAGKVKVEAEAEVKQKQIEREMTKIEEQAETTRKALEMRAEIKTAQAEAQMERYKSSIEGVTSTLNESTKALGQLFSEWSGDASFRKKWAIQDAIEQNMEIQERAADQQEELINKQIELMEQRLQKMREGEGAIKIESDGLQPHLEAFMYEVLRMVQIRATENADEFLLGVSQ